MAKIKIVGDIHYSKTTQIYYTRVNGVLWKYPVYPGAQRGWAESAYGGDEKKFTKVSIDAFNRDVA